MPIHQSTVTLGTLVRDDLRKPAPLPLGPEPAPDLPVFKVEILDADAVRALDRMLKDGDRVRLAAPFTERTEVGNAFALVPVEHGAAKDPTFAFYVAIVSAHGKERRGRVRDDHTEAARAYESAALRQFPSTPLATWAGRGEDAARAVMVTDRVMESFQTPPSAAFQASGLRLPDLTLWSGQDAARLDEERSALVRAETERQAAVAAVVAEEHRPRSWFEYGIDWVVRVPKKRPFVLNQDPGYGVILLGEDEEADGGNYYGGACGVPGLACPVFSDPSSGVSSIDVHTAASARLGRQLEKSAEVRKRQRRDTLPTPGEVGFLRNEIRGPFAKLDMGAIPLERFRDADRRVHLAHNLLGTWARRVFLNPGIHEFWLQPHSLQVLVAGWLLPPDLATELVCEHIDGIWKKDYEQPIEIPTDMAIRELRLNNSRHASIRNASRPYLQSPDLEGNVQTPWKKRSAPGAGDLPSRGIRAKVEKFAVQAAGARGPGEVGTGELLPPVDEAPAAPARRKR